MLLNDIFDQQSIKLNLKGNTKEAVFTELVDAIADVHPEFDREEMLAVIQDRENKMNTSVASGVAIPHGYYPDTGGIVGAIGISKEGIEYDAFDQKPVNLVFLIVIGEPYCEMHLHVLSRILSLVKSGIHAHIQEAKSPQEVNDILYRIN